MDENQPIRKKRSAVRYVLAEPTLFVTDAELIRRLGVPEKFAYAAIHVLDHSRDSGFPQKQATWGKRRYWPAVKQWFDWRNRSRHRTRPSAGAVFHQLETKDSEPTNSAASSSAAHTTEIESHRRSLLWIMNPAPQPAAALLRELASVRSIPDSIFGQGCSIKGTPGGI